MDIVMLAKYLNQISECEEHYDNLPVRIQKRYQQKATWIIEFFIKNGWCFVEPKKHNNSH